MRNKKISISLAIVFLFSYSGMRAKEPPEIKLTNEHKFIRLQDVVIVEKDGRTAIIGSAVRTRAIFIPFRSHIHIDLQDKNEELINQFIYRFKRGAFDHGARMERFFKYCDLSDPNVSKIVLETYTQKHTETCGKKEEIHES